jgi:AcrR family transcriptional regulator
VEEKKMDRRVKYTITALKAALVESMRSAHISKISVKSLCDMADVNRSTFYAHFKDPYDLLHCVEQEALDNIKQFLESQDFAVKRPISARGLNGILEYVKANAAIFKALLSDNCEPDIQREIMNLTQVLPIPLDEDSGERVKSYLAVFGITGCISILQKWLEDGTPESTAEIADLVLQALYKGMAGFW